jgi:hydroxymethylpyrimidine/phosphomethylpyrimidine kinase
VRPSVLTVAGSDSSGGAGIQADLRSIEANGCHAATAITAITAQNTRGVTRAEVLAPELVVAQMRAVLDDLDVRALKSGMLGNAAVVHAVAAEIAGHPQIPYVLDPVLVSQSGHALFDEAAVAELVAALVPLARVVTPNAHEAGALTGVDVTDPQSALHAGRSLLAAGARAVLVKGGHFLRGRGVDVLVTGGGARELRAPEIDTPHTHGSGCTYASAIAAQLARGRELEAAIERAKAFVTEAIRHGFAVGHGPGPTDPLHRLPRGDA